MAGVNKVIILGNLGMDPEVRTLESGAKLARLRIATSESYTNREGQKVENTEWHSVTVWRQLADIAEKYLAKGRQVYIEGKLQTRSWKDPEGNDRYATEIVGERLQLIGGRPDSNESRPPNTSEASTPAQQSQPTHQNSDDAPDDLPF
ncbi:single-stranded DNA-binding protein [Cryomorphaceae bacterium 1068]|nr:single-stranded DNA-binding protein [Cryomorphaceae bacterium 1068]